MTKRAWMLTIVGVLAIAGTAWLTMPSTVDSKEMQEFKATNAQLAEMAEHIKQLDLEFQQRVLGTSDFLIYQRCQSTPPTQPENIALCAKLERKVKAADAAAKARIRAEESKKW